MNKQRQLMKLTTKTGIIAAAVFGVAMAVYIGVVLFSDSVTKNRESAETAQVQQSSTISDFKSQLDRSAVAERIYSAIEANRSNRQFDVGSDGLIAFLREARMRYRLDMPRVSPPTNGEKSTKPEFAALDYDVLIRPKMTLDFRAISDVHAFSFIDALQREAPGIVVINRMELKRLGELNDATMLQIKAGGRPLMVEVKLEFTWITIVPKKPATPATAG